MLDNYSRPEENYFMNEDRRQICSLIQRLAGRARMNPFTTDHPLDTQTSWFDTKQHPLLSFVCSTFGLALILTPLVLVRLYYYAISDIGAEPNPFPEPWWGLFMGSVVAFVLSVICAFPFVLVFRLFARRWRRREAV
jgi:hypothetical protein